MLLLLTIAILCTTAQVQAADTIENVRKNLQDLKDFISNTNGTVDSSIHLMRNSYNDLLGNVTQEILDERDKFSEEINNIEETAHNQNINVTSCFDGVDEFIETTNATLRNIEACINGTITTYEIQCLLLESNLQQTLITTNDLNHTLEGCVANNITCINYIQEQSGSLYDYVATQVIYFIFLLNAADYGTSIDMNPCTQSQIDGVVFQKSEILGNITACVENVS